MKQSLNRLANSGERTRLACWFWLLAETSFKARDRICCDKFASARARSPAREARALPGRDRSERLGFVAH
jgi:hypothetical protein